MISHDRFMGVVLVFPNSGATIEKESFPLSVEYPSDESRRENKRVMRHCWPHLALI
jgi:hypothetical protein